MRATEIEDQGLVVVIDGHHEDGSAAVAAAVELLGREIGYADPAEDFAVAGRVERTWRGGDPTGEYAWLVCDEDGTAGFEHHCQLDVPCANPFHQHNPAEDIEIDTRTGEELAYEDCRCAMPGCQGDGGELVATDPEPVTIVSIDDEKLWRRDQAAIKAKAAAS